MAKKVSKDIPLAEITLRKYEKPGELSKRDLIKKLCLSVGLLQPGDSRDVIVDIFYVLKEEGGRLVVDATVSKEKIGLWVLEQLMRWVKLQHRPH